MWMVNFFECLFEVCLDVFYMFDANADAYLIGVYAGGDLFFFAQLFVSGGCRVYHQGLGVADVGEMAGEFQGIDEFGCKLFSASDAEVQDTAVAVVEISVSEGVIGIAFQAGVFDEVHVGVCREPFGQVQCVVDVPLYAQGQGLEALQEEEGIEGALGDRPR